MTLTDRLAPVLRYLAAVQHRLAHHFSLYAHEAVWQRRGNTYEIADRCRTCGRIDDRSVVIGAVSPADERLISTDWRPI